MQPSAEMVAQRETSTVAAAPVEPPVQIATPPVTIEEPPADVSPAPVQEEPSPPTVESPPSEAQADALAGSDKSTAEVKTTAPVEIPDVSPETAKEEKPEVAKEPVVSSTVPVTKPGQCKLFCINFCYHMKLWIRPIVRFGSVNMELVTRVMTVEHCAKPRLANLLPAGHVWPTERHDDPQGLFWT